MTTRLKAIATTAALALLTAPMAVAEEGGEAFVAQPDDPEMHWNPCPAFMPEGCQIAVLQGDPAEPNADILFRLQGGQSVPRHTHTSPERMLLLSGDMEVVYDGQDPVVLTPRTRPSCRIRPPACRRRRACSSSPSRTRSTPWRSHQNSRPGRPAEQALVCRGRQPLYCGIAS
jgi:quercetin dioxygenase-like cupin family protein